VPLLAHRLRKAAVTRGAKISFINPARYEYLFPVANYWTSNGHGMAQHLATVVAAASAAAGRGVSADIDALVRSAQPEDSHRALVQQLQQGDRRLVLLGAIAQRDPQFSQIRALAAALADLTGAAFGYLADGANTAAAHLAGVLPHRAARGQPLEKPGLNASDMLAARLKAYVLFGAIEPRLDIASPAIEALKSAEFVVALSPYDNAKEFAHVILPIGTFAETSGTYVNLEGRWQSVAGAATPVGESRPGWKVLRVLGNLLNLPNFDYLSSEQVRDEVKSQLGSIVLSNTLAADGGGPRNAAATNVVADVSIYAVDALVRRSPALQATPAALTARAAGRQE
jgi:NADH-quinone oxidoreductase subunit G